MVVCYSNTKQTKIATLETLGSFLKSKTYIVELLYNLVIQHQGIYPKEKKSHIHINTCMFMFISVLFVLDQIWKQPKCVKAAE